MTPNLFLATQKVLSPHKWFRAPKTERATRRTEYWLQPVPGQYEYIPGRGWYLIATPKESSIEQVTITSKHADSLPETNSEPKEFTKLAKPIPVHRSQILKRYLLEDEYKRRKSQGWITNESGKKVQVGFFQLDDGIAWVQCWDEDGAFIPRSEYKRWFLDPKTNAFRHLKKSDDPNYILSRSRNPSLERHDSDARSQQSASTGYVRSGTASNAPSMPSTRPSSIRGVGAGYASNSTSGPSSRNQSRRSSPRRNNSIPLEEAKAALRRMAEEQRQAVAAAAAARGRTGSKEVVERGRQTTRT